MIPKDKIEYLIQRYNDLEKELSSGSIDKKEYVSNSKEYSNLGEIMIQAKGYINFDHEKKELVNIIEDPNTDSEMKEMAKDELSILIKKQESNEKIIKVFLLPKDDADQKNAILEIRAGTGGQEASLFASDLFSLHPDNNKPRTTIPKSFFT